MSKNASISFIVFSGLAFGCALLVGFMEFFGAFYWFGVPILLLAVFLLGMGISRAAFPIKAAVIAICVLCVPTTGLLVHRLRTAEPETIPREFRGPFIVYEDEPCGTKPNYE